MKGIKTITEGIALVTLAALFVVVGTEGVMANPAEVVYDDFNDGVLGTNLGGAAGAMSYDGAHDPTVDFNTNAQEGAYALSLSYNFPENQWCGYWSFFQADEGGYDVSAYTDIRMWVRGAIGGEKFKVELKDTANNMRAVYITLVPGFESGATTSWQELVMPLYNFAGVDMSQLKQMNIVFDVAPYTRTVYIDNIVFTDLSPYTTPPSGLVVDDFNDGRGPNNLGGGCGTMDPDPEDPAETITESYVGATQAYEGLGALKLDYDRGTNSWVGYWNFMKSDESGYDVSSYGDLRVWVKGAAGGETFKVELKDMTGTTSFVRIQDVTTVTTSWQEATLDLTSFSGVDLTQLQQVNIIFDTSPDSGTVYIDLIRFTTGAVSETLVNISPASQEVIGEEEFTVDVRVTPATAIAGVQFDLHFDPTLVNVTSVTEGDLLNQDGASTYFQVLKIDNENGVVQGVAGAITTPGATVSSPGTFATIHMKAKMVEGTSQLLLQNVIVGDSNGQAVPITVEDGSVTVIPYQDWDVNCDNQVNVLDMIIIGQHWGETGTPHWIRADVNRDGAVNVLDMILVGQHWTG